MKIFRLIPIITILLFSACKKEKVLEKEKLPDNLVLEKIKKLGFSTKNIITLDSGYIVEGDIFLSKTSLDNKNDEKSLIIANSEQYRTTNLVTGIPRVILITYSNLGTNYIQGIDEAINRYNGLKLGMSFQRVERGGNINVSGFSEGPSSTGQYRLGSAGPPYPDGRPYHSISLNVEYYGQSPNISHIASVLQHEIGHCIGMRHTDYMNRSYSCYYYDPQSNNETSAGVGAINIPGTPSNEDSQSWMLACIDPGTNRSFNSNDIVSLHHLYPNVNRRVPIFSFYSSQGADHYLTPSGLLNGNNYWAFEGIFFQAFSTQVSGTVPVYSHYSSQGADHYFSTSRNSGSSYWSYEGISFYAYLSQVPGTVPIYAHYSTQGRDHYYSTSPIYGNSYWNFEGVAFYAFPK